jgi:hypothetical protein
MTNAYLPNWATEQEASEWLKAQTGEAWGLARLIDSGARAAVFLDCPDDASPALVEHVFQGRREGFMAQIPFNGDSNRMAIVRDSGTLTMTHRPDGELVKIEPPVRFAVQELRFSANSVRGIVKDLYLSASQEYEALSWESFLTLRTWAVDALKDLGPIPLQDAWSDHDRADRLMNKGNLSPAQLSACRLLGLAGELRTFSCPIVSSKTGVTPPISELQSARHLAQLLAFARELAWHMPAGMPPAVQHVIDELGLNAGNDAAVSKTPDAVGRGPVADAMPEQADPQRRLAALRILGGQAKYRSGKWWFTKTKELTMQEKHQGRTRVSEKTIRSDLVKAAKSERAEGPQAIPPSPFPS